MITNINHKLMRSLERKADRKGYAPEIKANYVQETYASDQKSANTQDAILLSTFGSATGKALYNAVKAKTSAKSELVKQFSPVIGAWKNAFAPVEDVLEKVKPMTFKDTLIDALKHTGKILKGAYDSVPKSVKITGAVLMALAALHFQNDRTRIEAKYDAVQYMKDNA